MDTFNVTVFHDGENTHYEIVTNEGHFGIKLAGKLIAEIQCNEEWEQTSGVEMPAGVFEQLIFNIETSLNNNYCYNDT